MLSVVKMLLKEEVGGSALNSHGNYIVDHGKSGKNHGIVYLNFCGNPGVDILFLVPIMQRQQKSGIDTIKYHTCPRISFHL